MASQIKIHQEDLTLAETVLDENWYRLTGNSDASVTIDSFFHFATIGWREGRSPTEAFDTAAALAVPVEKGFAAYIDAGFGGKIPKQTNASALRVKSTLSTPNSTPHDKNILKHFDGLHYTATYGREIPVGMDPLDHFMNIGWKKGFNPSENFNTEFYLETYSDIKNGNVNPFEHYVIFGLKEGRSPNSNRSLKKVEQNPASSSAPSHMDFIMKLPSGPQPRAPSGTADFKALDIHWIVPDFATGGGGHMTIFRTIRHLEGMGHKCTIWIERRDFHTSSMAAYEDIIKHFQCVRSEVHFFSPALFHVKGDIIVATGWTTAYIAAACSGFKERFYFVQDFEPSFYATGADSLLAEQSYHLGLSCICASPWLSNIMVDRYDAWARSFYLAYNPEVYRPDGPTLGFSQNDGRIRICLYARDHTPRRAISLALMALDEVGRRGLPVEIHFFGQDDLTFDEAPYEAYNHGVLDAEQLATLYRSCDFGVCFSATNYSLIPQEMMACGLPLVELDGDSTRTIFPENVVALTGPHPMKIADTIDALISDPTLRKEQAENALEWVAQFDWLDSAKHVEKAFVDRLQDLGTKSSTPMTSDVAIDTREVIDIVIPTWNGMQELPPVIDAIRNQKGRAKPNIICIDSSSTDGTTQWLAEQPDITLKVIDQSDFQHGRTRNLGASLGTAPLITFLTQDAIPADSEWLHNIWAMMTHYRDAAGLFGRHIAYPNHSKLTHHELTAHFDQFSQYPLCLSKKVNGAMWGHDKTGWKQVLHFYSDNNSCMRRKVWEKIPYPEVDYGEDQVWANTIIEAGYCKLYAPSATVIHSHDFSPEETYKRCQTESHFFLTEFGYTVAPSVQVAVDIAIKREQQSKGKWLKEHGAMQNEIDLHNQVIEQKYLGYAAGIKSVEGKS